MSPRGTTKADAAILIGRLWAQIEARLPEAGGYGGTHATKLDQRELADTAVVLNDYLRALRDFHELPDSPSEPPPQGHAN